ncbi:MAG: hypothetical protein D6769_02830 [Methanobacteriota archaeon]|nr:MAG: hypothetical protein D6769_02830 [Euryarchaeota archaeon]
MELELAKIRERLDRAADRLMLRLRDRTYFPQNLRVYEKDGIEIRGKEGVSFAEYALEELEKFHAKLGRFRYKDQVPLIYKPTKDECPVERDIPEEPIWDIHIELKDKLFPTYVELIKTICNEGDDPTTYGETVYCDADVLYLLADRIQVGRYVAEAKLREDPSIADIVNNTDELRARLTRKDREKVVIQKGEDLAERYGLTRELGAKLFRTIIDLTLGLEVDYLKKRAV